MPVAVGWPETPQIPGGLEIWPPGGCVLGSRPFQKVEVRTPYISGSVRPKPLELSESRVDERRVNRGVASGSRTKSCKSRQGHQRSIVTSSAKPLKRLVAVNCSTVLQRRRARRELIPSAVAQGVLSDEIDPVIRWGS